MTFRKWWVAILLTMMSAVPALAQDQGRFAGTIRDQTNAFVSAAKVKVKNERTGEERVILTNQEGYFEFITVKPGAYLDPVSGVLRAPHINASFTGSGLMRRLVTTLFFPGEPGNDSDPALAVIPDSELRARLILQATQNPRAPAGMPACTIDIVLQGEGETPFFVD